MEETSIYCSVCPRNCLAPRDETKGKGFCAMPLSPKVARIALHHWEEPCLSGKNGAGTVFFSGCSMSCVYCQNASISQKNFGKIISVDDLRKSCEALIAKGAHNIDLVNPTHFAPAIEKLLEKPFSVPVIWNSGGYDKVETLAKMRGKIQIYLPDFKYMDEEKALAYSGIKNYVATTKKAIEEMYAQVGTYVMGEDGLLKSGLIIRHLLLPRGLTGAKAVMDWVVETFPKDSVLFSLMGQYTPMGKALAMPPLHKKVGKSELAAAYGYMADLGLAGYTQEIEAATKDFIPDFDLTGLS